MPPSSVAFADEMFLEKGLYTKIRSREFPHTESDRRRRQYLGVRRICVMHREMRDSGRGDSHCRPGGIKTQGGSTHMERQLSGRNDDG